MKCPEARRHLDPFMDGELPVPENLKVLEHLNLCAACGSVFEGEKRLRELLKADLGAERAPAGLADRLLRSLDPAPAVRRPRWGLVAAAAALFLLAGSLIFSPAVETPRAFAAYAAARHDETRRGFCGDADRDTICCCVSCTPSGEAGLARMFRERVDFPACTHDFREMGYTFTGGAVFAKGGRMLCWTSQAGAEGRLLSHAVFPTPVAMGPGSILMSAGGRTVVFKPNGGVT